MSRPTVADIVVDGLGRAGTPGLFCAGAESASSPLSAAARAAKLPVTRASGDTAACVMAAVSGDLVEAPGAVLVGFRPPPFGRRALARETPDAAQPAPQGISGR